MEDHEKIDGKMKKKKKSVASIPANYVSILQLQQRWLKEKEQKQKEKDYVERGVKQQVDHGQRRREDEEEEEEDAVKVVKAMETKVKLGEKGMQCGVKKEEIEVSAIVVSNKDDVGGDTREKKKKYTVKENARRAFKYKGENAAKEGTHFFQNRWIKKKVEEQGETSEVKEPARLNTKQDYHQNQRHDLSSTRVMRATTSTMVWVKKGKNDRAAGDYGV
ncbi:unnamed protein product [Arabidopsis lyrata]|uniref:cilia- and flagella-associated protein 251 n=1 Tax=Arabidopsis lyrata subsp. lyrata TaxID=81972 RepID=UPI000A29B8F9|nr:cilia- and flagella-associated protein 251 [Arabidopsis lyrata subsp. lyrata]CAH8251362.1 unnamed protein product [Arabidopsis lyrata]|eukprot:XP_020868470.1 cilia- and flagella-associated protein 251 [Arabidopsis lyrata subsp. lyrata]